MSANPTRILVVGTGPVGLIAAMSLSRAGFAVDLAGPDVRLDDRRTTALMVPALNHLRGPLPSLRGLGQLRVLKANNNLLSGPLPQLNAAPRLERLQLANNALSGSLRHGAGQQALRVVDVSNNQFSGPMPSLADMPQLRRFDASFNRLSGAAPTGHHPDAVLELEGNRLHNSPPTGGS